MLQALCASRPGYRGKRPARPRSIALPRLRGTLCGRGRRAGSYRRRQQKQDRTTNEAYPKQRFQSCSGGSCSVSSPSHVQRSPLSLPLHHGRLGSDLFGPAVKGLPERRAKKLGTAQGPVVRERSDPVGLEPWRAPPTRQSRNKPPTSVARPGRQP